MTPTFTNYEMRDRLAARVKDAGSTRRFAKMHGLTQHHIERVLTGACEPCPPLERALGLRGVTVYETYPPKPCPTADQLNPAPMTAMDACQRAFERAQDQPAMSRPEMIQDKLRIARTLAVVGGA